MLHSNKVKQRFLFPVFGVLSFFALAYQKSGELLNEGYVVKVTRDTVRGKIPYYPLGSENQELARVKDAKGFEKKYLPHQILEYRTGSYHFVRLRVERGEKSHKNHLSFARVVEEDGPIKLLIYTFAPMLSSTESYQAGGLVDEPFDYYLIGSQLDTIRLQRTSYKKQLNVLPGMNDTLRSQLNDKDFAYRDTQSLISKYNALFKR